MLCPGRRFCWFMDSELIGACMEATGSFQTWYPETGTEPGFSFTPPTPACSSASISRTLTGTTEQETFSKNLFDEEAADVYGAARERALHLCCRPVGDGGMGAPYEEERIPEKGPEKTPGATAGNMPLDSGHIAVRRAVIHPRWRRKGERGIRCGEIRTRAVFSLCYG